VSDQWPYPDDRFERRTRVAHMYRDRLADIDAAACAELDEVMAVYGQTWVFERNYAPPESLLTEDQVAEWADVSRRTVQKWVERGHLERRINADKQVVYLLADLIEYQKKRHAS
jgi:hypothetical protein